MNGKTLYKKWLRLLSATCVSFSVLLASAVWAGGFNTTMPTALSPDYKVEVLVPGSYFHGLKGINFDQNGDLIVNDLIGGEIRTVNIETGEVGMLLEGPLGLGDDLVYGPHGELCWTGFTEGKVYCMYPGKNRHVAAEGLPFVNGIAYDKKGRLFATQVFAADGLWELDPTGKNKPRKVMGDLGWLNAFEFGPDGKLYGPLMRMDKRSIVRIDVDTQKVETIATGFKRGPFTVDSPNAVKFDSQGELFGIQASTGFVYHVDIDSGKIETIAELDAGLDNLVISPDGKIYITNMIHNTIYEVDSKTKKVRTVIQGRLATPQGISVRSSKDGDTLYVADAWCLKKVDAATGEIEILWESHFQFPKNVWLDGDTAVITGWLEALSEFDITTKKNKRVLHGFHGASKTLRLSDGSLIVAMVASGEILKVSGEKGENRSLIAKGLKIPSSIELAGPGAIYVLEAGPGVLSRLDLTTGEKKPIASGLAKPVNMAAGPDGKLLILEIDKKRLIECDPATGTIKPLVGDLPIGIATWGPPIWTYPGVAVSNSGNIYVTADIENAVYKIIPAK